MGGPINPIILRTAGLLALSNVFMTFAWYAHLRNQIHRAWYAVYFIFRGR